MQITKDIKHKIRNFGALQYSPDKICTLLGLEPVERAELIAELNNPTSELKRTYEQSKAIADYNIDAELTKKAEKGDIMAILEIEKKQYMRNVDETRKKLFGI